MVVDWFSHVLGIQHVDRADVGHGIIGRGQLPEPRGAMCKTPQILLQDVRRSGVQDGCSCMNIRGMRGLVASAS